MPYDGGMDDTMKDDRLQIFKRPPELHTPRLILRPMRVSDAGDMFDYARREEVTRFLLWQPHPEAEYTEAYLRSVQKQYKKGEFYDWALVYKPTGKMIGTCGFTSFDLRHNKGEIGYVLNPDFWGRGLATEAVERVLRFGLEELGLHRLEARYMVENAASRRVMEKCGMVFEGVLRDWMLVKGIYRDIGVCAIIRQE